MEYYFDTDDKLERKKYAEFLKSMLENCDKYRREDSDGAYVIAIDSPWGTGKTRFAKMLRNYLEDRTRDMKDDSLPGKNASFSAIYYNSWETDFSDDALLPLVHSITKSPEFKAERFSKKSQKFLEKFKEAATAVTKVVVYSVIHNLAGETVTEMVKAADDAVSQQTADPLESYQDRLNLLDDFRRSLEKVIEHTKQKKLVIIIDELDRCRPTFAIQTLEIAKHLFNVNGLFFIFAIDITQLCNSVNSIYGTIDASGYLCRFFDYIGKIPFPDKKTFIEILLDHYKLTAAVNKTIKFQKKGTSSLEAFVDFVSRIEKNYHFSYRDLTTIFATYRMMFDVYLKKYTYLEAYKLYFVLLSIKYKKPDKYDIMVSEVNTVKAMESIYNESGIVSDLVLIKQLKTLVTRESFAEMDSIAYMHGKEGENELRDHGSAEYAEKFRTEEEIEIRRYFIPIHVRDTLIKELVAGECELSLNLLLFKEDLKKWDTLKFLTPMRYYHQQLEMFNFALPADNAESEE